MRFSTERGLQSYRKFWWLDRSYAYPHITGVNEKLFIIWLLRCTRVMTAQILETISDTTCTEIMNYFFVPCGASGPMRIVASSFLRFVDHTRRRITVGWTPLEERSALRRDLYLITHDTHNRQISMLRRDLNPNLIRRAAADLREWGGPGPLGGGGGAFAPKTKKQKRKSKNW